MVRYRVCGACGEGYNVENEYENPVDPTNKIIKQTLTHVCRRKYEPNDPKRTTKT
jgi:hypothetical protein